MSRKNDTERDMINYDCIYYDNRTCKALNKLYCRNEKCNFYRDKKVTKNIPIYVTKDGKVKRKIIFE